MKSKHVIKVYILGCMYILITQMFFFITSSKSDFGLPMIKEKLIVSFTSLMSYWRWHVDNPISSLLENSK